MSYQPKSLTPISVSLVGAKNELLPSNPPFEPIMIHRKVSKPIRIQRIYIEPDINKAQETPLYPPYQNYPDALDRLNGAVNNKLNDKLT